MYIHGITMCSQSKPWLSSPWSTTRRDHPARGSLISKHRKPNLSLVLPSPTILCILHMYLRTRVCVCVCVFSICASVHCCQKVWKLFYFSSSYFTMRFPTRRAELLFKCGTFCFIEYFFFSYPLTFSFGRQRFSVWIWNVENNWNKYRFLERLNVLTI